MKLIVEHLRKFDAMLYKFEKLISKNFPKEFESEDSEIEDRHEHFIYLSEE